MKNLVVLIRNAAAADFGGAERIPVFISRELEANNFNPIIYSHSQKLLQFAASESIRTKQSWWWSRQQWSGWRVVLLPAYFMWQLILTVYYLVEFSQLKPTTVHIQSKDDFIAATLAAKLLRIHCFWSDYADLKHIWLNHSVWYKNPVGKLVYFCARFTSAIVVVSHEDLHAITNHIPQGSVKDKLTVIHNGVYDNYKPAPEIYDFVSTARLVVDKGIAELIDAFSIVSKAFPDATLAIVGDGPDRKKFERQARGIKGISFFGHQENPLSFLFESKIFILPTYHEGFSIALLEAFMASRAVIATNVGGNPELVDDQQNGLLVPSKDPSALAEAMLALLSDPALVKKLGSRARDKFKESYDFHKIVKKHFIPLYGDRS